jgi:hypothetical protein
MTTERLLLCRPLGGLNDMLCQIDLACRYAERFDRTVIVDTKYQSKTYFRDSFSNYFVSRRDRLVLNADEVFGRLDELDVFPQFLAGRVSSYGVRFDGKSHRFVEGDTGLAPTFDSSRDYDQPLLVHHSSGGGTNGIGALGGLRLQDALVEVLVQRLGQVGRGYSGVHVRNTDYKAKYEKTMVSGKIDLAHPIFLATDNRDTLAWFRSIFGPERIHAFARLPDVAGERLHHIDDPTQAFERNRDSILDLVMLALASRLYLFELQPNAYGAKYSGFSVLAANLHNAKPVLRTLISDDEAVLAAVGLSAA